MARKWTEAQLQAMNIRNKTLLVSAAAGSGKTATLTERIIRRITDSECPADISKMLIVTFTRAAAAELRSRIFSALGDALAADPTNKHLTEQLMKVGSAQISTIDSFYFDLIQSNISSLGITGAVRIADDTEYSVLSHQVMEELIDRSYEELSDFPAFVECFAGVRQLNTLPDIFLNIHQKLSSIPEGIEFLRQCSETAAEEQDLDFFATTYGEILRESTMDLLAHYYPILRSAVDFIFDNEEIAKKYGDSFSYDLEVCERLCTAVVSNNSYSLTRNILFEYSPIGLSALPAKYATEESKHYKDKRGEFVEKLRGLAAKAFSKSPETISRAMGDTAHHIENLYRLLWNFEKAISEEKARLGILTFTDIRRLTLALLVDPDGNPTNIAKQYAEKYTDIFIDEYQDVDCVQDLIFSSISKPDNRFMVGDIKQSIYEFRGAEPLLFANYRETFPLYSSPHAQDSDAVSIFMSNNFRCDKNIIDFTNLVCSRIFSAACESIGYTDDDDLKFSKITDNEDYVSPKVKIAIIQAPTGAQRKTSVGEELPATKETEAEYIAEEIQRLLKEGKKADGSPIIPGDIAVLFRAKSISPYITEALRKRGILTSEADASKYFESPEVLLVLSLLHTIDNPERDTYLAGTLRSPLFGFDMDELLTIRLSADSSLSLFGALCQYADSFENELSAKCNDFIEALEIWQNDAKALPIDRFMRLLFDSERFLATGIVSQPNDDGNGGNLLLLYEYARGFESGSFKGLYQFLEYINAMIEKGQTFSSAETGTYPDRVSLMTIHRSKGLEFPVCFVCGTTHSIRSKDISSTFVFDYHSGVALKISDKSGMARINTPMREAIISRLLTKQAEEEMRILYVALTRARERLYVTAATTKDIDKLLAAAQTKDIYFDRYSAINVCTSYLDWILVSCVNSNDPSFEFDIRSYDQLTNATSEAARAELDEGKMLPPTNDQALTTMLKEKFSFVYPYASLSKVPSKLSVSRLYPDVLDENDSGLELFTEKKPAAVPDYFVKGDCKKALASDRGTATHLFMQFCDFKYARDNGASAELARLTEKRFIPPNIASLVYIEELERFLDSALAERILSAKNIIREQRFNVTLPADSFTSDPLLIAQMENEQLAVQGVIDLILIDENGDISLYDYKTDRLTDEELADDILATKKMNDRHGLQLSYYAMACEILFGKPCKNISVYSTHAARLFDINIRNAIGNDTDLLGAY